MADTATYRLEMAFDELVAGVFTVDGSALDGTDGLSDVGLFDGTFDDISDDVCDQGYQVVFGTDDLMDAVQAANLTVTVARVDDPGYWNPNNPGSPIALLDPGFVPMRPVQLVATVGGVDFVLFRGFLRHANWTASTRSCELYFEDLLLWASRVNPTIASTGTITVGQLVTLLWLFVDPTVTPIVDDGTTLDDFTADGTQSVTQIIGNVLQADLGTVFVRMDGTPIYEQFDTPYARNAAATITITEQASDEQSGIDLDDIFTRVTVEKLDPTTGAVIDTWTEINAAAEKVSGRSDASAVSSAYVDDAKETAQRIVYEGVSGKPPLSFTIANVDETTLLLMLQSQLQTVFAIDDDFGGTVGDVITQQQTHTITTGLHQVTYLGKRRSSKAFTVDGSALDGTDGLF